MGAGLAVPGPRPDARLRRLEWTVLRKLDGLLLGDYRGLFRGFGMDLAEIREYQFGDDVRFIDWNVSARLSAPYVRRFDEDREITAWLILDLSPSVHSGFGETRKLDVLLDFSAVLARLLTKRGNRVGALLFDGRDEELIPARGGRMQVLFLLDRLGSKPRLERSPPTDLRRVLMTSLDLIKRRSLVFIVSDFISSPGWSEPLSYLARRNEVIAVRLLDPLETELPDLGILTLQDTETGEQLHIDSHDRGFRDRFHAAALRREEALRAAFDSAGADALELSTEDDIAEALLRFAQLRKRRAQLAGSQVPSGRHRDRRGP
jgi:uncharacterized protein (DUF58 family)